MNELQFKRIRKSLLMSWKVCPRQAWYSVRDPEYGQYNEFNLDNMNLLLGQVFHKEMDKFYNRVSVDHMKTLVEDKHAMKTYLFSLFSPTTHEKCLKYFTWYAEVEAKRFIQLYKEHHTGVTQLFIPLYIEKYVEMNDDKNGIIRDGHFDRVDYIGGKNLRLVEYKTGVSYDVAKTYKLTKLRLELYYYKKVIENLEEFKGYTVADWMLINPTTEQVFISKFSVLTEKVLEESVPKLISDINGDNPPDRNLNFYCDNCKFKQDCLIIKENIWDF